MEIDLVKELNLFSTNFLGIEYPISHCPAIKSSFPIFSLVNPEIISSIAVLRSSTLVTIIFILSSAAAGVI